MKAQEPTKMKEAIEMLIENDISLECGCYFYKCWSGEYIVQSHDWDDRNPNATVGWYKEFKSFSKAYKRFAAFAFSKAKLKKTLKQTHKRDKQ